MSDLQIINSTFTVEDLAILMPLDITLIFQFPPFSTTFNSNAGSQATSVTIKDSVITATSSGGIFQYFEQNFNAGIPLFDGIWSEIITIENSVIIADTTVIIVDGIDFLDTL